MKDLLGLLGHPVVHSVSPAMHEAAFRHVGRDAIYIPLDVEASELSRAVRGLCAMPAFVGCNVTIPHKLSVMPLLDRVDPEALEMGAVNTVYLDKGWLCGANTDAEGFRTALPEAFSGTTLILGCGGAARAVVAALRGRGPIRVACRRLEAAAGLAVSVVPWADRHDYLGSADLVVNATPLGLHGREDELPLDDLSALGRHAIVYDLIYNPARTRLLQEAERRRLTCISGITMLAAQGARSWRYWFGTDGPRDVMEQAALDALGAPRP